MAKSGCRRRRNRRNRNRRNRNRNRRRRIVIWSESLLGIPRYVRDYT